MTYPMIFLAVGAAAVVVGGILLAVFAWGEWHSNPWPDESYGRGPNTVDMIHEDEPNGL